MADSNRGLYSLFVFGFMYVMKMDYYNQLFGKENYASMDGLYTEDVGNIGTRNDFSHMDVPLLNPIFVPVVKGETE